MSTRIPEGAIGLSGIGCHSMVVFHAQRHPIPMGHMAGRAILLFGAKALRTEPGAQAGVAQAARIARKAPQTMVKVSKAIYGATYTFSNLTYISRNGDVPMFDQDGVEISDVGAMRALAEEWRALNYDPAELDSRHASPDARRLILSMPRRTDPDLVLQAVRAIARRRGQGATTGMLRQG